MENPKSQTPKPKGAAKAATKGTHPPPYDLKERTFQFAIRMLRVASQLPRDSEAIMLRRQLARSGASIGANVEEADGATSRPDKRRGFIIARKEARETRYWLRIVAQLWGSSVIVDKDIVEVSELIKILSPIILKME